MPPADQMVRGSAPISVVIPTFNRREMLQRALDSVHSQSLKPREVIIVDDASDDHTSEMLKERYQASNPPVRVVEHQRRQGVSSARNSGIAASIMPWIAFLDSDDQWHQDKLMRQWQMILQHRLQHGVSPDWIHCDEIWIRGAKRIFPKKIHAKPQGWIFKECLKLCCVSPSAAMIHRNVFDRVGTFNPDFEVCEDYDLWLRIAWHFPILLVEEPLLTKYGGHTDQLSQKYLAMDQWRLGSMLAFTQREDLFSQPELASSLIDEARVKARILALGFAKHQDLELAATFKKIVDELNHAEGEVAWAKASKSIREVAFTKVHLIPRQKYPF